MALDYELMLSLAAENAFAASEPRRFVGVINCPLGAADVYVEPHLPPRAVLESDLGLTPIGPSYPDRGSA